MLDELKKYNYWESQTIDTGYLRKRYIDNITNYLGNRLVKVILGQRRVGKSYLLRMIIDMLHRKGVPPKNIIYINKDISELDFIDSSEHLIQVVKEYRSAFEPKGKVYIILDEVQDIKNWERAVNSFSQDYKFEYEVFITGSNANLLSMELSTYLTGRYIGFEVFPFSYEEYLGFFSLKRGKDTFLAYLKNGGIPESLLLKNPELRKNYLSTLKDSIVLKDIVKRHSVRDVFLLEKLILFIIDSIGSLFSVNKVVNYLNSAGHKCKAETIGKYISYLVEAYLVHESERYDIKGKRILSGERKYYLNDLGFKYYLSSSFDFGVGKYLENLIYLDLRRKGYTVYTGRLNDREIDFIAEKDNEKIYVQVCYLLADEKVVKREFGNLKGIDDNFEKMVISLDDVNMGNKDGIKHVNAWEFVK